MKAILLTLLLLLCLFVQGQSPNFNKGYIAGTVVYGDSSLALAGASCHLRSVNTPALNQVTVTDKEGKFVFHDVKAGSYSVAVTHVGYEEYRIEKVVLGNGSLQLKLDAIKLKPRSNQLKEVLIEAAPKAYVEQRIDRTVINVGALIANTGTNAAEVLNNAPAVEVTDEGVSLRGKQSVSIYIDGKQTFLDGKDLVTYLRSLPSSTLYQLELMPNPPAKYHVNGNAGVINIITKKTTVNGFNGNVSLAHGQGIYAKSSYSANLNYKIGKLNLLASTGYSSANNYSLVQKNRSLFSIDPGEVNQVLQHNFETNDQKSIYYKLGIDYEFSKRSILQFSFDGFSGPYLEKGDYKLQFIKNLPDSVIRTNSALKKRSVNYSTGLNYNYKPKPDQELSVGFDYLNYQEDPSQKIASNTYLPDNTYSGSSNLLSSNAFNANVYSIKADYEALVFGGVKLSTGMQGIYSDRNTIANYANGINNDLDSLNNTLQFHERIAALYISAGKKFGRFSLQAGLRYENTRSETQQSNFAHLPLPRTMFRYNNLFPSLYLSYNLDTSAINVINFSANSSVQRPGYSSLNPSAFYFDKYNVLKGNALLQPSRTTNIEVSLSHGNNLSIGLFYNRSTSEVITAYELIGQSLISTLDNINLIEKVELYGNLSLLLKRWWTANIYSELYRWRNKGTILGDQFINTALVSYSFNLTNQFKFSRNWSAEMGGIYRSAFVYGQAFHKPMWTANAAIKKNVFENKGTISLSGRDLFHSWINRREILLTNAAIDVNSRNDTRQANLAFTYRFGSAVKKPSYKNGLETEKQRAGAN